MGVTFSKEGFPLPSSFYICIAHLWEGNNSENSQGSGSAKVGKGDGESRLNKIIQ